MDRRDERREEERTVRAHFVVHGKWCGDPHCENGELGAFVVGVSDGEKHIAEKNLDIIGKKESPITMY